LSNALKGTAGERETKLTEWTTAFLLVSLIPVIGVAAAYSYLAGVRPESSTLGIAVALAAMLIMPVLWYEKRHIGYASKCLPLIIDAAESSTCFLMSAALLAGLTINYVWRIPWVDYAATVVILAFVAREGREAILEIL
jgi:divalent metal cation (Fe/Co/Zn/Cd) transporter